MATAGEFVIKDKAKLGLGASYESDQEKTTGGEKTVGALDWEKLAAEAMVEVPEATPSTTTVKGTEDDEVSGPPTKRAIRMDTASKLMAA